MSDKARTLLPCPFCGGEASFEAVEQSLGGGWSVGCSDEDGHCYGYQSLQTFARKAEAAAAWNRRYIGTIHIGPATPTGDSA